MAHACKTNAGTLSPFPQRCSMMCAAASSAPAGVAFMRVEGSNATSIAAHPPAHASNHTRPMLLCSVQPRGYALIDALRQPRDGVFRSCEDCFLKDVVEVHEPAPVMIE